ncbi:MAG: MerC domain-containing protein [Verrucomicrobiales bacterium]|nr:MerC domain-containing protein [Verrucomicrobiales bacterium]
MTLPIKQIAGETPHKKVDADRVGVFLSVLCAIHCAATPFLLILLPTFGKIWSHPASHWGMALFVVPIAVAMFTSGYRRHKRKWIVATGTLGVLLIIVGAILPYTEAPAKEAAVAAETSGEGEDFVYVVGESDTAEDDVFLYVKGEEMPEASCSVGCTDNCCPSLVTDADGKMRLNIPPASIVTTLGGISLILTHVGNLCCCSACRRRKL